MDKGMGMSKYEVVVGNVGTVYSGLDLARANSAFRVYMVDSQEGCGRAAYETVTLICDGEVVREYNDMHAFTDETFDREVVYETGPHGYMRAVYKEVK